jgi:hypothetical protein
MNVLRRTPIKQLWETLAAEADEADRARAALDRVMDWAHSHEEEFLDRRDADKGQPPQGWAGKWEKGKWPWIGFSPKKLREILEDDGFEYEAIVRTWKDRDWLLADRSDPKGRYHQVCGKGGDRLRTVAIKREAIHAAKEERQNVPEQSRKDLRTSELIVSVIANNIGVRSLNNEQVKSLTKVLNEAAQKWADGQKANPDLPAEEAVPPSAKDNSVINSREVGEM